MFHLQSCIPIQASPERVWAVLADLPGHAGWNPFMRFLSGHLQVGQRLQVRVAPPGKQAITFRPVVLQADAGRALRWRGHLLLPGLFDGEHYFELQADVAGGTRLTQGEQFSGLLAPVLRRSMQDATLRGFEAMNAALKCAAESSLRTSAP